MLNVEHTSLTPSEQWSALHDGELSGDAALALVRASLQDDSLMQQWRSMSVVSQVMREQSSMRVERSALHVASALAPHTAQADSLAHLRQAANSSRWRMVAGFSALAALSSLIWGLLGGTGADAPSSAVLASHPSTTAVLVSTQGATGASSLGASAAGSEAVMIRNPRLDEFLAAHKQFGGVSALQQPAGSLRSVSVAVQRP